MILPNQPSVVGTMVDGLVKLSSGSAALELGVKETVRHHLHLHDAAHARQQQQHQH